MTSSLYQDYLKRARVRLEVLDIFFQRQSYADAIRESQEVVELLLKALLRKFSIDPPHWHDVSRILIENQAALPEMIQTDLNRICAVSKRLRKERELSFYGDEDFIPSDEYTKDQAKEAISDSRWLFELLKDILK